VDEFHELGVPRSTKGFSGPPLGILEESKPSNQALLEDGVSDRE